MFKKLLSEVCSRSCHLSLLVVFFSQAKKVMNMKRLRNHLQGFASEEFIFHVNNKEFKPCPSLSALASLGHAIPLTIISQNQKK